MKKLILSIIAVLTLSFCFVACGDSKVITVTFDGNGGVTIDKGVELSSVTKPIDLNGDYVVPIFQRDGYTFIGWDTDVSTLTKNAEVKALWKAITYEVTFDLNGGTLVLGELEQTVEWNKSATAPEIKREGYTFDKWDTSFENVTKDITVKAIWKINTYKVTFDLDGGTLADENFNGTLVDGTTDKYVLTVDYGTPVTYPKIKHNDDMVQSSWQVIKGNTDSVNSDTEVKAIWTGMDGKDEHTVTFVLGKENVTYTGELEQTVKLFASATAPVVEDLQYYKFVGWNMAFDNIVVDTTVTAKWQEIKHTITFDTDGGILLNGSLSQQTTEGKVMLPTVTKGDYYEFLGWYVGEDKVEENTLYAEDTTVTAKWKEIKYTITFDTDGGTLLSGSLSQQTNEGKVTLPTVKKTQYKFLGWYDGETKVDENTLYKKNTDLKAKWVKVEEITIKFVDKIYNKKCDNITVKYGAKIGNLPVLEDSTDEYSFKGWYYLDGNKEVSVTKDTILQVDETELTLYAKWSANWTPFY